MSGSCHLVRVSNVEIHVESQIFVIVIFCKCGRVFSFECNNSKEIIFSDLYYCQIQFSCWLKKSKQTFNTNVTIQHSVQMTWTRHKILGNKLIFLKLVLLYILGTSLYDVDILASHRFLDFNHSFSIGILLHCTFAQSYIQMPEKKMYCDLWRKSTEFS